MPAAAANANFSAQRDRSMQLANNGKTPLQSGGPPRLRLIRPNNPYVALGVAVNHLMGKPAFANLRFGDWSRALVGQINREHYYFAIDEKNQVQGLPWLGLDDRRQGRGVAHRPRRIVLRRQPRRGLPHHQCLGGELARGWPLAATATRSPRYIARSGGMRRALSHC
jgi:hypothetical protein